MAYTPMFQQYLAIKKQHQDCILFFRMGDFYEMFFEDATLVAQELEITLTARDGGGGNKVPMCGVPYHAAETYLARLIASGHRVAICEQVEEPKPGKGLVKREVVRVVTPGTVMESQCLDDKSNNYLASILISKDCCGLACSDISTGLFKITHFYGINFEHELLSELARLAPAEIILPSWNLDLIKGKLPLAMDRYTIMEDSWYQYEPALQAMNKQFGGQWLNQDFKEAREGIIAAGVLLQYLEKTQKRSIFHINRPVFYSTEQYMKLDATTRRNLELTASLRNNSRWGTLLWVLDYTNTAMGGRLLKNWLEQPLVDTELIQWRLDAVEELASNLMLRQQIKGYLGQVYDLERLVGKITYGTATARDLLALRKSIDYLPALKTLLQQCQAKALMSIQEALDDLHDLNNLLHQALVDEPPLSIRDGGIIKSGYHAEVDRLRAASGGAKDWLARIETQEREKTGIKTLKVGYNKIFGYYLEVTKANLNQVPPHYIRRQTLVNAERYITPEIKEYEEVILGAEDRLVQLEYELFRQVRQTIANGAQRIQQSALQLAMTDVFCSLAEAADRGNYVRPAVNHGGSITIDHGRHPVLEKVLDYGDFVPNDTGLGAGEIMLLTGPNMAGKSTYMRQVALITLMAQMGSFVPAASADIGMVDRIFTRIGAADDLAGGRSTFMVEMSECRDIIANATNNSLIIMDEVGRGTSTYDGISIARALLEHIYHQIGAKTLFSTHYHELTDVEGLPGVHNYTISVREIDDQIIFLRQVLPGKVDRSYGIQVAKLAGLPETILNRAKMIMLSLEPSKDDDKKTTLAVHEKKDSSDEDPVVKTCREDNEKIMAELAHLDIKRLTPLEALNLIARWQEEVATNQELLQDINVKSKNKMIL